MFARRFIGLAFVVMLFMGMLAISGSSAYRAGWSQGFVSGSTASEGATSIGADSIGEGRVVPPVYGPGHYGHRYMFNPFWGIGLFFKLIFFLFFGLFIFKLVRFGLWRMAGRSGGVDWERHKQQWQEHWTNHHGDQETENTTTSVKYDI